MGAQPARAQGATMKIDWTAVLAAVAGAVVAAVLCGVVSARFLPGDQDPYATREVVLACSGAAAAAVVGTAIAVLVGRVRGGGGPWMVAAMIAVGGTVGFLVPWVTSAARYDETGLFIVGALMIAVAGVVVLGVIALVAALLLARLQAGRRPGASGQL